MQPNRLCMPISSAIYGLAFICLIANYTILRDGLTTWNFRFNQNIQYISILKRLLLILSVISILVGTFIYYFTTRKRYTIILFSIGTLVANVIILYGDHYKWVVITSKVNFYFVLGNILAFSFMGALQPCLVDFGFKQIPDNNDYFKVMSIYAGVIFFGWILGQLISWDTLVRYQTDNLSFSLMPIILCVILLLLVIFEAILNRIKPTPDSDNTEKNSKVLPYSKVYYIATVLSVLFSLLIFYLIKYPLVKIWLGFANMTISKFGYIIYSTNTLYEHYLYSIFISCFILKIILHPKGLMWPITTFIIGIGLMMYALYLSAEVNKIIKNRYNHRFTRSDYDHTKLVTVNLVNSVYNSYFYKDDHLMQNFSLTRMQFSLIYFGYRPNYYKTSAVTARETKYYDCEQSLLVNSGSRYYGCPKQNLFHNSTILAIVCVRSGYGGSDHQIFLTSAEGKTYKFQARWCKYIMPGIYEVEYSGRPLLNTDIYTFSPGGSYFILLSLGTEQSTNVDFYNHLTVVTALTWKKPLTMSMIFLFPQFIMLGITEMLLFISYLELIYIKRDNKFQPFLMAIFFGLSSFGILWDFINPSFGLTIYANLRKFMLLFCFGFIVVAASKILQLKFNWTGPVICLPIENFLLKIQLFIKKKICGVLGKYFLKLIAKDYEKALKFGMCVANDPEDEAESEEERRRRQQKEDEGKHRRQQEEDERQHRLKQEEDERQRHQHELSDKEQRKLQKQKDDALRRQKEEDERLKKKKDEKDRLQKEEDERLKKKQDEKDRLQKEEDERLKKKQDEKDRLQKEEDERLRRKKEEDERHRKEEEERSRMEDVEGRRKQQKEDNEKQRLQKIEDERLRRKNEEDERRRKLEDERRRKQEEEEKNKKPAPPYSDPNARTIYNKDRLKRLGDDKSKATAARKGATLHNPTYGADFLDKMEKK